MSKQWILKVGLEIHAQITSKSKLFSGAKTLAMAPPNSLVAFLDAGLPGTLPVLNTRCVEAAILTATVLNCKINKVSHFDRKHYFYADMPQGYQITQQRRPIAVEGLLRYPVFDQSWMKDAQYSEVRIRQIQLEQDSGKSLVDDKRSRSYIDLNRAGVGLMEIVTEPDMRTPLQAMTFAQELALILKHLGVCDCRMYEGQLRVDANVSIHDHESEKSPRTEIKNLNSFRFMQKAIQHEYNRQVKLRESDQNIVPETRSYDYQTGTTVSMRDKEIKQDYRFMPEPNLPPLLLTDNSSSSEYSGISGLLNIDKVIENIPDQPSAVRMKLINEFKLSVKHAFVLVSEGLASFFFSVAAKTPNISPDKISSWIINSLLATLNSTFIEIEDSPLTPGHMSEILTMVEDEEITPKTARVIIEIIFGGRQSSPRDLVESNSWWLISDEVLITDVVVETIQNYRKLAMKAKKGKLKSMTALKREIQKKMEDKANPKTLEKIIKNELKNL